MLRKQHLVPAATLVAVLACWQASVAGGIVPAYLVPTPVQVAAALAADWQLLAWHAATTLLEAAIGLAIGVALGFAAAVAMDRFETVYLALEPIITVSQTVPTIAIAPLLVLWLGYGLLPKVVLIVITTFFPIAVSLVAGFKSVDPDTIDLMRTMKATRWQVFVHVKLPAASDQFFSGLKISATYAIVGAVIAEWLGGNAGLGVYMTRVRKSFSYDRMFAVIIVVSALSLALMAAVDALQRICQPWRRRPEGAGNARARDFKLRSHEPKEGGIHPASDAKPGGPAPASGEAPLPAPRAGDGPPPEDGSPGASPGHPASTNP